MRSNRHACGIAPYNLHSSDFGDTMNRPKNEPPLHQPFSRLKLLVENRQLTLSTNPRTTSSLQPDDQAPLTRKQEDELFAKAMNDVTPLRCNRHWRWPKSPIGFKSSQNCEEEETVATLRNLIHTGPQSQSVPMADPRSAPGPRDRPCQRQGLRRRGRRHLCAPALQADEQKGAQS